MFVSREQDLSASSQVLEGGQDLLLPVGLDSRSHHLQTLAHWHCFVIGLRHSSVHLVESWVHGMVKTNLWWRIVVGLPPEFDLVQTKLIGRLLLVKSLQRAVVSLVDSPALVHVAIFFESHLFQNEIRGFNGPIEHAGVSDVEVVALLQEFSPGFPGLLTTQVVQRDVNPACELAGLVPD